MINIKGGTGFPFISNLGNRDMKNFMLQKLCSVQNGAKRVLLSMAMMETMLAA